MRYTSCLRVVIETEVVPDLVAVRDLLAGTLGPEFLHAASTNRDQWVSKQVIHALSAPPPSAAELDAYLTNIAKTHGVQWEPELRSEDVYVPFRAVSLAFT